jgi:3-oxoacyl-[acyl-carrier-protein] synthase-3
MIIMATATPDMPCFYRGFTAIGATNAFAYDLQAACSSFLYGMSTATFNQEGIKKVLLIGQIKCLLLLIIQIVLLIILVTVQVLLFLNHYEGLGLQDEY